MPGFVMCYTCNTSFETKNDRDTHECQAAKELALHFEKHPYNVVPGVLYRCGGFLGSVGSDYMGSMDVPISRLSPKALAIAQGKPEYDPNGNTGF